MAYDFGQHRIGAGGREHNDDLYIRTLLGQSIRDIPVPEWTAQRTHNPFVAFEDPGTRKVCGITKDALSYGTVALGPSGTGKTNFFNMILDRVLATMQPTDVICIFDTKGDYLETFGGRIPADEKVVIGNGAVYQSITSYHNIFAEIMPRGNDGRLLYTPEECDGDAFEISKMLFQSMQSETQPIFPLMAEQLFAAIVIYYMRTYWQTDQAHLNNRELIQFIRRSTNEELRSILEMDGMMDQRGCTDYIAGKSNQTQGVKSYLISMTKDMFVGPFVQANPAREFSMRDIVNGGRRKVVFIEYDLQKGNTLSPMYGMLISRALAEALGGRQQERTNRYFLLDEMLLLPTLERNLLSNSLNFGRSQGVKVLCGLQNVSGLEELYGEAGARNILSAFQNMIVFRTIDPKSREYVIGRMGENYQGLDFSAQQTNLHIQRAGHTIEDWDLMNLANGEAVMSLVGERPFLFTLPMFVQGANRQ